MLFRVTFTYLVGVYLLLHVYGMMVIVFTGKVYVPDRYV